MAACSVFPTLVGVFLSPPEISPRADRLPHARGGVSCTCFYIRLLRVVFPTLVGVFPKSRKIGIKFLSLPHARGGVSSPIARCQFVIKSSPRSWGCFLRAQSQADVEGVFPTLVGVFP